MYDPLRVGAVTEGLTDRIVIEAALRAILPQQAFVMTLLQPEGSIAFGQRGGGWGGVVRWCKQSAQRGGGKLRGDSLVFNSFDLLIIHVDADVAGRTYAEATIAPDSGDGALPCELPCPPAEASVNALRDVILSWCGEEAQPPRVVLCVPSKNTETWVVFSLFPEDAAVTTFDHFECFQNPGARLSQQPKSKRIKKSQRDYRRRAAGLEMAWSHVAAPQRLGEALRFQREVVAALASVKERR